MSLYIEVLNNIKQNFDLSWLTNSQREIFNKCKCFLVPPNKIINIFGREGTGKTFVGWVLSKENIGLYFSSVKEVIAYQKVIILDNCDHKRKFVRELRNTLRIKRINHAVILTRHRAEDDIPAFQLDLTEDDLKIFKHNLFFKLNIRIPESEGKNLWDYLRTIGEQKWKIQD